MSRLHLISSEVNGVLNYYTADSSGAITNIGTTQDFSKGFDDSILSLISNSTYSTLTNGKVWTNDTDVEAVVTTDTNGSGVVMTRKETAINTKGYSGVSSIVPTATSGVRFGISFSGNEYFYTRGNVLVTSTAKKLPASATDRAKVATIDSSYNNLFDGDTSTTWSPTIATTTIPITFATATKIKKFCGNLAGTSLHPVSIKLQVYNDSTSAYQDITNGAIIIDTTSTEFNRSIDNNITATKYQFVINYTDDGSGKLPCISELNMYEEITTTEWVGCSKAEVATKGMSATALSALSIADFATIFSNYQLDYYAYIPAGDTFTQMVVNMPPNTAPSVAHFTATPNPIHAQAVDIGFTVTDPENQGTTYKVTIGDKVIVDTTATPAGGVLSGIEIPNDLLAVGTTNVVITATDEIGADESYSFPITKIDQLPTYVGSLVENTYTYTIDDADGDMVNIKTQLNGETLEADTGLISVPHSHSIVIPSGKIKFGVTNTLLITVTDAVGGTTTITETFIGDYYGLMFADIKGDYYTDDIGELLKYLDLGVAIAGRPTQAVEFQVINNKKGILKSVGINAHDISQSIKMQFEFTDQFSPTSTGSLSIGDMLSKQKTNVFMRIDSSDSIQDSGDYTFTVSASGIEI